MLEKKCSKNVQKPLRVKKKYMAVNCNYSKNVLRSAVFLRSEGEGGDKMRTV